MDAEKLLKLLESMGLDVSELKAEDLASRLSERIVLKKFDGDQTTGTPVETLVIEDGNVVEHTRRADGTN